LESFRDIIAAEFAAHPTRMLVPGEPIIDNPKLVQRRIWAANQSNPTLRAVPRRYVVLDFDDEPVPAPLGRGEKFAEAAAYIRDHKLTGEFFEIRCVAIPSASTGLKGDAVFRGKLVFALSEAHELADLKRWARGAAVVLDTKLDSSVIQAGQPNYVARPVFKGMRDPVPRALHAVVLNGSGDVVNLNVKQFDREANAIVAAVNAARGACGADWRAFMDRAVGTELSGRHYFEPLTQGSARRRAREIATTRSRLMSQASWPSGPTPLAGAPMAARGSSRL
jgi:hypothetical protein